MAKISTSELKTEKLFGEDESEESDYFHEDSDDENSINDNIEVASSPAPQQILDIEEVFR